jgi:hypothetical protein
MQALVLCILLASPLLSQTAKESGSTSTQHASADVTELQSALRGDWVGVLQYRDYSEPPTSTKRVDLPTWLTISGEHSDHWRYIYDDGPTKTVVEDDSIIFDPVAKTYSESSNGKPANVYQVSGFDTLKAGRGILQMSGRGNDNGAPSEIHMVITVRRNLLEILDEVRPAGSQQPFSFRHMYRMVRAQPPGAH